MTVQLASSSVKNHVNISSRVLSPLLNIVSLPKYFDEIKILFQKQDLDILALNETRLDKTFTDDSFSINNYDLIRTD